MAQGRFGSIIDLQVQNELDRYTPYQRVGFLLTELMRYLDSAELDLKNINVTLDACKFETTSLDQDEKFLSVMLTSLNYKDERDIDPDTRMAESDLTSIRAKSTEIERVRQAMNKASPSFATFTQDQANFQKVLIGLWHMSIGIKGEIKQFDLRDSEILRVSQGLILRLSDLTDALRKAVDNYNSAAVYYNKISRLLGSIDAAHIFCLFKTGRAVPVKHESSISVVTLSADEVLGIRLSHDAGRPISKPPAPGRTAPNGTNVHPAPTPARKPAPPVPVSSTAVMGQQLAARPPAPVPPPKPTDAAPKPPAPGRAVLPPITRTQILGGKMAVPVATSTPPAPVPPPRPNRALLPGAGVLHQPAPAPQQQRPNPPMPSAVTPGLRQTPVQS